MNVLHIITGLNIGGAERALYNILIGGVAEVGSMAVLSLQDDGFYGAKIRSLGVPVYSLNMKRGMPTPIVLWRLRQVVRELRPDIIQGWMYHGNLAASVAARLATGTTPAVVWNIRQCLYSLSTEKPLTRKIISASRWSSTGTNRIIYNSRLSREQHEQFGFASSCGHVISNGFDTDLLRPDINRGQVVRESLKISQKTNVIGHVARFHPMKDHASFLCAAVNVMRRRSDFVCLLAGRDVNLQNPSLSDIVPPEFVERFYFVGERNDVPDLMQAMDIFCQSSCSEAFPNVLGEAMSLETPCIATAVGDSSDVVGDTGVMVPPSDIQALTRGILSMLDRPLEERARLGQAARIRIRDYYSISNVVEQYSYLYATLKT